MRIAAHQPNFLPWVGYFRKLAAVDVFVLLNDVQIPQGRSWASRTRIETPNGEQWLTIPIRRPHGSRTKYTEAVVEPGRWLDKMRRTLVCSYARQPHYADVLDVLERDLICAPGRRLASINAELIANCNAALGIHTPMLNQSDMLPHSRVSGCSMIVELCTAAKADVYVSGIGARAYNNADEFARRGVKLQYIEHEPSLSIIDHAMRNGWNLHA